LPTAEEKPIKKIHFDDDEQSETPGSDNGMDLEEKLRREQQEREKRRNASQAVVESNQEEV
jgi:hypothetical protein